MPEVMTPPLILDASCFGDVVDDCREVGRDFRIINVAGHILIVIVLTQNSLDGNIWSNGASRKTIVKRLERIEINKEQTGQKFIDFTEKSQSYLQS